MVELLIVGFIACPIVAITVSFLYGRDAASPMGDGMILGVLVLAVPLWPITMPLWTVYILSRHRDAVAEQTARSAARSAALLPVTRRPPPTVDYGYAGPDLRVTVPRSRPTLLCRDCGAVDWAQASPIRHRFGTAGASFLCRECGATRNFDIDGGGWVPSFP